MMENGSPYDIEGVSQEIRDALFEGRKIQAIKLLREEKGLGLKDAKEEIEALELKLREVAPTEFKVEPSSGKGCMVSLVLLGFAVGGLITVSCLAATTIFST